jgi:hypothetical protein
MFEDGSAALWLALNPKNYSGPTEISRFQQGWLVNVIGSKHPLPGGVILKEVRGIARDQEGGIWLFDLNQGLFRLADGMLTRIANALELEHNYRVLYRSRGPDLGRPTRPSGTLRSPKVSNIWDERWCSTGEGLDDL